MGTLRERCAMWPSELILENMSCIQCSLNGLSENLLCFIHCIVLSGYSFPCLTIIMAIKKISLHWQTK